jgi:hypothetical protein
MSAAKAALMGEGEEEAPYSFSAYGEILDSLIENDWSAEFNSNRYSFASCSRSQTDWRLSLAVHERDRGVFA